MMINRLRWKVHKIQWTLTLSGPELSGDYFVFIVYTQRQNAVGSASESGINAAGKGTKSGAAGLSCRCNYDMDSKRNGEAGT